MDENLNPFDKSRKPRKKQKPRLGRGFRKRQSGDCYLAGAVDESVVDFLLCLLWLVLLLLLWLFL